MNQTNSTTEAKITERTMNTTSASEYRYISVKNEGQEIYTEAVTKQGTMAQLIPGLKMRLDAIRKAMPRGTWTMKIEQTWPTRNSRFTGQQSNYQIMDVETGELTQEIY